MDSLKGTVILFTPHTGQGLTRDLGLCKNMESASKLFKVSRCWEMRYIYGARWGALTVLGARYSRESLWLVSAVAHCVSFEWDAIRCLICIA